MNTQSTDTSDALARELTGQCLAALQDKAPADDVALAAMTAALNVALELLPPVEVSDWLRRLADTIDEHHDTGAWRPH